MFITNNQNSFHLWWKENFLKHQKVSKRYDQHCLKNFLLLFIRLLRVPIFKKKKFVAELCIFFLKTRPRWNFKSLNTKFSSQWKDLKNSYQVKQILSLLFKLVTLILSYKYVKGLRVTKNFKQIKFKRIWNKLEAKHCFQRQSWREYIRQTLVLVWNSVLWQKVNFNCWTLFCFYWQNFHFGKKNGH